MTMKPKHWQALLIILLVFSFFGTVCAAEKDNPAYGHALALRDAGILFGFPDGSFGLDRQLTRGESIAILLRALKVYEEAGKTAYKPIFSDVPQGHWAAPYILYAYEKGMTRGVSATEFAPERYVTAQEFCTLLLRYLLNEPEITPDTVFGWIVTQTPLDINYIEACFEKDKFLRADMVNIVYEMCVADHSIAGEAVVLDPEKENQAPIGSLAKIELISNATTGYTWTAEDNKYITLISDEYITSGTGLVGAPGAQILTFKAINKGSTEIVLNYARPWETDTAPAQTIKIKVNIV